MCSTEKQALMRQKVGTWNAHNVRLIKIDTHTSLIADVFTRKYFINILSKQTKIQPSDSDM